MVNIINKKLIASVATLSIFLGTVPAVHADYERFGESFARVYQVRNEDSSGTFFNRDTKRKNSGSSSESPIFVQAKPGKVVRIEPKKALPPAPDRTREELAPEPLQPQPTLSSTLLEFDTPLLIDNGDLRFATQGTWSRYPITGYNHNHLFTAPYAPPSVDRALAVWSFSELDVGEYDIYVTWPHPSPVLATNASYKVVSNTGIDPTIASYSLNQQQAPTTPSTEYGGSWEYLGRVNNAEVSGSVTVSLSNDADGYVLADAIYLTPVDTTPPPAACIDESHLLADWNLDEGEGIRAHNQVNGVPLKLFNGVEWTTDTAPVPNNEAALTFDGKDDHVFGKANISFETEGSYSFWFKPGSVRSNKYQFIFHADNNMGMIQSKRSLWLYWRNGTPGGPNIKLTNFLDDGDEDKWFHVVVTNNNGDLTAYVNGEVVGSNDNGGTNQTAKRIRFGSHYAAINNNSMFGGSLDELQFYDIELTQKQVLGLMNGDCEGGNGNVGNLHMKLGSTVRPMQVLGSAESEDVYTTNFTAEHEGVEVTTVRYNTFGIPNSIDSINLYKTGEANPFAQATRAACGPDNNPSITFCAVLENQQLLIPEDKTVGVEARLNILSDNNGGVSGQEFGIFSVLPDARGVSSNRALTFDNENGNTNEGEIFLDDNLRNENLQTVMAKIVSIVNANPDNDGSAVPVGIESIGQFKFTAANHQNTQDGENDVLLDSFIFTVDATNATVNGSSFIAYNKNDSSTMLSCEAYDSNKVRQTGETTGPLYVFCTGLADSPVNTEINQGEDLTLVLEGSVLNPQVDGLASSSLQVSLQQFADFNLRSNFDIEGTHVSWQDNDAGPFSPKTFNWIDSPETVVRSTSYANSGPNSGGELQISIVDRVNDTIPRGAQRVNMLSTNFAASCSAGVVVENVDVVFDGIGDLSNVEGVYAIVDGLRATRVVQPDSTDRLAELRFMQPLVLDPCESKQIDYYADFKDSAGPSDQHRMKLELSSDVTSNASSVTGQFPFNGPTFTIASVENGEITVEYRSLAPDTAELGDQQVVIGKVNVSVDGTEDQTFYSMTLEQMKSAQDGDFVNIAARRTDGTVLTRIVPQTVNDFVTLVFDPPFTVLEGDQITFEVIADIVGGPGRELTMHFEEESDLFAVGSLYGYGVNGQLYGSQVSLPAETPDLPDTLLIGDGQLSLTIDGPASQQYTPDDTDAVLANVHFTTGGENFDFQSVFAAIEVQDATGNPLANGTKIEQTIEDVEIRDTRSGQTVDGVLISSITSSTGDTYGIYRFDSFTVLGTEHWELRVDFIENNPGEHPKPGDEYRAHICTEPTHNVGPGDTRVLNPVGCDFGGLITSSTAYQLAATEQTSSLPVGDIMPRGTVSGNFHSINQATLTVAMQSLNATDTTVENAKNVNLLRFEARANDAEDILFTNAEFTVVEGTATDMQNYAMWVDTDGDSVVDTILEDGVAGNATGNASIVFTDFVGGGYVIAREETVVFELHTDVSSDIQNGDAFRVDFATSTPLQAEELDDGTPLDGISTNGTCGQTSCTIFLTTVPSTVFTIANQGSLFVTLDSTPVPRRQLLGGELSEPILRLELLAQDEDIDVTDLQFSSTNLSLSSVDRLELSLDGATTPFALATVGGCGSDQVPANTITFCANMESRQLVVLNGVETDVIVRARLHNDNNSAVSGEDIQFYLDSTAIADESTGAGAVRARGDESSNNLVANNGDGLADGEIFIGSDGTPGQNATVGSSLHTSVLAKITSITNANPDPNGTAVPVGISDIGQFKITAAANNNSDFGTNRVVLESVVFNVAALNVELEGSGFSFFNKSDSSSTVTCLPHDSDGNQLNGTVTGNLFVECTGVNLIDTEIRDGEDDTFVLQANVTNPSSSTTGGVATLQVSLQQFNEPERTTFGPTSLDSHFRWNDEDGGSSTTFLWVEYPETVVKSTSYAS